MSELLIEALVTTAIVVALALTSRYCGPRIAGAVAGLPTSSAITLFLLAVHAGPDFASQSALYNPHGIPLTLALAYGYYCLSRTPSGDIPTVLCVLKCSAGGFAAYALLAVPASLLPATPLSATLVPLAALAVFRLALKPLAPAGSIPLPQGSLRQGLVMVLGRCVLSSVLIFLIVKLGKTLPSRWAGLLSSFPVTVFPLILVVHTTSGTNALHALINNLPRGLTGVVAYALTVHFTYPALGALAGTAAAFAAVAAWLVLQHLVTQLVRNR